MTIDPAGEFVPEWTDGEKLRKIRRHLGLNQEEFAARLQVKAATYAAWETDRNRVKDMRTVARRIKAMAGTPLWWWFDTERPDNDQGPDGGGSQAPGTNRRQIELMRNRRSRPFELAADAAAA